MERFVRLAELPPGLTVPADLADRMRYDVPSRSLAFRGFMSKADFDRLYLLSESWPYRRALEELFRACTLDADAPRRGLRRLAGVLGLF